MPPLYIWHLYDFLIENKLPNDLFEDEGIWVMEVLSQWPSNWS
jgi:hypothetical protein